ncbi:hypothetical protein G7046_g472 [Stylonectria norvegica]|nr:hypothetical protein G7046_g472 [Stylonectria norvegica]
MERIRRCVGTIASRCTNRRFLFAIAAVSVLGAKVVHIYAHFAALSTVDLLQWGLSFFAQDFVVLLMVHILLGRPASKPMPWRFRLVAPVLASIIAFFMLGLATFNISFFAVTGSELHWRNIGFAGDASSRKVLLSGMMSCLLGFFAIIAVSWVLQDLCDIVAHHALNILAWPFTCLWSMLPIRRRRAGKVKYAYLSQQEAEGAMESGDMEAKEQGNSHPASNEGRSPTTRIVVLSYAFITVFMLSLTFQTLARPNDGSFTFMSWTLPLLPFVDFAHSSPTLASLLPVHGTGINYSWDNSTALDTPIKLSWLPKGKPLPGFEDWYKSGKKHYNAALDPIRISNLDNDVLPELRDKLKDINIRHVVVLKLESTRKDVFPLKKDGLIWNKLADSFENKSLSNAAREVLSSLTPAANFITGDYEDGFEHSEKKARGGINFKNAHTASTYTLKSLTASLCGLNPLVADWNMEIYHHIYQPCLPHIFEAFNQLNHSKDNATTEFTSFEWESSFMQSVTGNYDKQNAQMPMLGFPKDKYVTMEYLRGPDPKFGPVEMPNLHEFGLPEFALEDYVRDAFASAKKDHKRVFLTHLTGTTHHPFLIPKEDPYTSVTGNKKLGDLSRYLSTIGYVDGWLQKFMDILEEEGVADETLVVFVGDHGISIAEHHTVTPYYAPHVANFHVPLVLSHPKLPQINIEDAVTSLQILPTILDLLLETGSLSESESRAALDLIANYEGQSLLRPINKYSNHTRQPNWQYTVMNPGRALLSVRDGREPNWRMVVPIIDDLEWRFTDLGQDPSEKHPILSFSFKTFLETIERERGIAAAEWAEEAAFMSRWWLEENNKRWQYDPFNVTLNKYSPFNGAVI